MTNHSARLICYSTLGKVPLLLLLISKWWATSSNLEGSRFHSRSYCCSILCWQLLSSLLTAATITKYWVVSKHIIQIMFSRLLTSFEAILNNIHWESFKTPIKMSKSFILMIHQPLLLWACWFLLIDKAFHKAETSQNFILNVFFPGLLPYLECLFIICF